MVDDTRKPPQDNKDIPIEDAEAIARLKRLRGNAIDKPLSPYMTPEERLIQAQKRNIQSRRGKRIYNAARPLSKSIYKTVYPNLKGKDSGTALSSLMQRWPEIVGKDIAHICTPLRITKPPTGYVLVLETTSSAAATKLKHQSETILERVNAASGARFYGLHLQQTQTPNPAAMKTQSKLKRRLSDKETQELSEALKDIESSKVKQALMKLGEAVLAKSTPQKSETARKFARLKSSRTITRR